MQPVAHCNDLQHAVTHTHLLYALKRSCKLQRFSTRCNTVHHTATHSNTLQHTAAHTHLLYAPVRSSMRTAIHCNTLQHTAAHCNTLQHTATHCNTLQHTAAHCSTLQHLQSHSMRSQNYEYPYIDVCARVYTCIHAHMWFARTYLMLV